MKMKSRKPLRKLLAGAVCSLAIVSGVSAKAYAAHTGNQTVDDVIDQIETTAGEIYQQMDEAVDNFDAGSIKMQIREALEEMDAKGISPTAFAREKLGLNINPASGIATGITGDLMETAQRAVEKESQGPLQDLFDRILGGVSDFVSAIAGLISRYLPW